MKEGGNSNKRALPLGTTPWNKISNRSTTPQGPRSDTRVIWEPLDVPPAREIPRTRVAQPRQGYDRPRLTQEEELRIRRFEEDIQYAQRGLDQIRQAFDYKAADPKAPLGADIDRWSQHYGKAKETRTEMLGRWFDTLEGRLRDDARRYFAIENELNELKNAFTEYKRTRGVL